MTEITLAEFERHGLNHYKSILEQGEEVHIVPNGCENDRLRQMSLNLRNEWHGAITDKMPLSVFQRAPVARAYPGYFGFDYELTRNREDSGVVVGPRHRDIERQNPRDYFARAEIA